MIFVVNFNVFSFSNLVLLLSNVFFDVIKRRSNKDDAHRSKGIIIFVLRLIKSRLLSPRLLRRFHSSSLWLLCRVIILFGETNFLHPKIILSMYLKNVPEARSALCFFFKYV